MNKQETAEGACTPTNCSALVVTNMRQTCSGCPTQWEATTACGRMIYVRYRWGWLNVRVSPNETKDIMAAVRGDSVFCRDMGKGDFDGFLEESEMRAATEHLVFWPDKHKDT